MATTAVVAVMAVASTPADAARRNRGDGDTAAKPAPVVAIAKAPKPVPQQATLAIVSIGSQRVRIFSKDGEIGSSGVSSGQSGHATPTGVFSVIQKDRHHRSNIYNDAPMPFMQRITWSGVALHEGNLPGYAASHGCIRLPGGFASRLWGLTKLNMRVIVAPRDTSPFPITHAALPTPMLLPAPDVVAYVKDPAPAGMMSVGLGDKTDAEKPASSSTDAAIPVARMLNPAERAEALKVKAAEVVLVAKRKLQSATDVSQKAQVDVREVDAAIATVQRQIDAAKRRIESAAGKPAMAEEAERLAAMIADTEEDMAGYRASEAPRLDAARTASAALETARRELVDAESAVKDAARRVEPISVFVSRKEGKIYIRQAFEQVYQAPIAITDAARPIGTHVFQALGPIDGGKALSWRAVTVPTRNNNIETVSKVDRKRRGDAAVQVVSGPQTAANALARIELPEEAKAFIQERLWTGASFMVSDEGISRETGKGTDFVLLTR